MYNQMMDRYIGLVAISSFDKSYYGLCQIISGLCLSGPWPYML